MADESLGRAVLTLATDSAQYDRGLDTAIAKQEQLKRELFGGQGSLKAFAGEATRTGSALKQMVDGFSGAKLAAEAAQMVDAVKTVGGVARLTEGELRQVAATTAAAVDKFRAMGEAPPEAMRKLAGESQVLVRQLDSLKTAAGQASTVTDRFGSLRSALSSLGPLLPVASVAGLTAGFVSLVKAQTDAAGRTLDLANKTGLSTDAIQEMELVASKTGSTVDAFAAATFKLGVNISAGGKQAREALADLGVEYERFRGLRPEAQFREAVRALEDVADTQERNRLGMALFGKQWAEIAASVAEGYSDMAGAARKSSREQLEALDTASEALEKLQADIAKSVQGLIANVALGISDIERGADSMSNIDKLKMFVSAPLDYVAQLKNVGQALRETAEEEKRRQQAAEEAANGNQRNTASQKDFVAALAETDAKLKALKPDQIRQLNAAIELGSDAAKEYAESIGLDEVALDRFRAKNRDAAKDIKAAAKAQDEFNAAVKQFNPKVAAAEGEKMVEVLGAIGGPALVLPSQLDQMAAAFRRTAEAYATTGNMAKAREFEQLAKTLSPVIQLQQRWNVTLGDFVTINADYSQAIRDQLAGLTEVQHAIHIGPVEATNLASRSWVAYARTVREHSPAAYIAETTGALENMAEMFARMGQISAGAGGGGDRGGMLGGFLAAAGQIVVQLAAADKQAERTGHKFGPLSTVFDKNAKGIDRFASGFAAAAGVAQGAMNVWDATGRSASRMQNAFSGAMQGAQAGAMFGPWGVAVGAAAGLVVGLVRGKPGWAKAAEEVGRDFGAKISEELGKKIDAEAKDLFKGSRQAASIFNLDEIIKEAGGLNAGNMAQMTARLRDVFSMVETGAFSAAQATEVLDENFAQFAQAGTDAMGRLSPELKEIIALTRRFGLESRAVTEYLQGQATTAIAGWGAVVEGQTEPWRKVGERIKDAKEALKELEAKGDAVKRNDREWIEATRELADAQAQAKQMAAGARGELEALGVAALAAYNAAIESGMSPAAAMQQAGPMLQQLRESYEALGLTAENAGVRQLLIQEQIATKNPTLIAGAQGLGQAMAALDNMGLMTADTFTAMQQTGSAMYARLQAAAAAAGGSTREALLPMQDYLHQAVEQAEALNVPLDANTQMLVDQSKELGIWKDKGKGAAEQLNDTMGKLNDTLSRFLDGLEQIPSRIDTTIRTRYETEGEPPPGTTGASGSPSGPSATPVSGALSVSPPPLAASASRAVPTVASSVTNARTTTTSSLLVLPILHGSELTPYEIGSAAASYLAESGLALDSHGVTRAVEKVVMDVQRTYGSRR